MSDVQRYWARQIPDDVARRARVVFATDYDALAAELDECIANCADPKDKRRIRELEAALIEVRFWCNGSCPLFDEGGIASAALNRRTEP